MALWMIEIQYVIRNEKIRNKICLVHRTEFFSFIFINNLIFLFFLPTVNRITYIRRECMQIPDIDEGQ